MEEPAEREFPRASIEGRNSRADNLIIIDNVVYDVTQFLDEHPGGPEVLLDNGGKDASACFRDVGHSDIAFEWRRKFRVGVVPAHERRPELAPPGGAGAGGGGGGAAPAGELSPGALLSAAAPPLVMAVLAVLVYVYVL